MDRVNILSLWAQKNFEKTLKNKLLDRNLHLQGCNFNSGHLSSHSTHPSAVTTWLVNVALLLSPSNPSFPCGTPTPFPCGTPNPTAGGFFWRPLRPLVSLLALGLTTGPVAIDETPEDESLGKDEGRLCFDSLLGLR